jgi:uncharacterized membrane protein
MQFWKPILIATIIPMLVAGSCVERPKSPSFSIKASTETIALVAGKTASATIQITRDTGLTDEIAFSVAGTPTNVTASFSPEKTAQNSTVLTLAAGANFTTSQPVTLTITATGVQEKRTVDVRLTAVANTPATFDSSKFDEAVFGP